MIRKKILPILRQTATEWSDDQAPMLGAALAYYTVFSLAPLLLIIIALAGWAFGEDAAQGQVFAQLRQLIGDEGGRAVQDLVSSAGREPSHGVISAVTGMVALLFGASGVFGQLQSSLNTVWGVAPPPNRGILGIVKARLLSFGFVLGVGFLLLVSLALSTTITFVAEWVGGVAPGVESLVRGLDLVLSIGVITALFALIFKFLPDARIAWKDVWVGALLTSVLFTIGKFGLALYLGTSSVGSSFGAAGSLIVLLLWVYYSAQILFFGAEFTQVWANRYGSRVAPIRGGIALDGHGSHGHRS